MPVERVRRLSEDAFLKAVLHDRARIESVKHFGRHIPAGAAHRPGAKRPTRLREGRLCRTRLRPAPRHRVGPRRPRRYRRAHVVPKPPGSLLASSPRPDRAGPGRRPAGPGADASAGQWTLVIEATPVALLRPWRRPTRRTDYCVTSPSVRGALSPEPPALAGYCSVVRGARALELRLVAEGGQRRDQVHRHKPPRG
jgi:hypothetical protein